MQVVAPTPTAPEELARLEAQQAAEAAEYERLKAELQAWCLATAFLCSVATLTFYSKVRCPRAGRLFCSDKHGYGPGAWPEAGRYPPMQSDAIDCKVCVQRYTTCSPLSFQVR